MSLPSLQLIDNRYVITKLIASGGMAEIYEANDTYYHRSVSIKILKESSLKKEDIDLFKNEIRFGSAFNNSHIYKIYNVGQYKDRLFMVYESMKGRTIKDILDERGRFGPNESLAFMLQLVEAIKLIHSRDITHNDIKPDNIILLHDGTVKLVDFGIATHLTDPAFTHLMASPKYLAPEVIRDKKYTIQSDIYSLGITLFEFITGKTPFMKNNSQEEIHAHLYDEIPSVKTYVNFEKASDFDYLIKKCTEKNLNKRYKTVKEFENDLLTIKSGNSLSKHNIFSLLRKRCKEK